MVIGGALGPGLPGLLVQCSVHLKENQTQSTPALLFSLCDEPASVKMARYQGFYPVYHEEVCLTPNTHTMPARTSGCKCAISKNY